MIRTEDANRSEVYQHASWSRSHDLRHHLPPGGFSALAPHQEAMHQEALLAGYRIPQPNMQSFSNAQLPPAAMTGGGIGGAYFPPVRGAQDALIAKFHAFQKAEEARTLKENQTKEASMYEQLGRATAAATAISFQGTFAPTGEGLHGMQTDYRVAQQAEQAARALREKQSRREFLMYAQLEQAKAAAAATSFQGVASGRSNGAPFQYQGMPHLPPWATLPSVSNANMAPSVTPDSSVAGPYSGRKNSHTNGIATATYQSPPQYQASPPGPLRHPQEPARRGSAESSTAGERVVRHPATKVKKPPKKKLCRYYLKSSKQRNYSSGRYVVPNKTDSADTADI
jgi:hypothetical protein